MGGSAPPPPPPPPPSPPLSTALMLLLRARYFRHEARVACTYTAIINYSYSIIKVGGLSPHTFKSGGAIVSSAPPPPPPPPPPSYAYARISGLLAMAIFTLKQMLSNYASCIYRIVHCLPKYLTSPILYDTGEKNRVLSYRPWDLFHQMYSRLT